MGKKKIYLSISMSASNLLDFLTRKQIINDFQYQSCDPVTNALTHSMVHPTAGILSNTSSTIQGSLEKKLSFQLY